MITQYDIKMAAYIVKALRQPNLNVYFSWGGYNYQPITDGVQFETNGFIHAGKVQIVYDHCEDLFIVRTLNADGTTKDERTGIYVDMLQSVVDRLVECDCSEDEYKSQVDKDPLCSLIASAKAVYVL